MGDLDGVFIERLQATGPGVRVAVKNLVDVAGCLTTAGCRAVAAAAVPAAADAACVALVRRAGGVVVGTTNLHELAYGTTGTNPWYGTPVNPADPTRVPGGSSSGSAVAVALGECDVAVGTDTGGSVRIPAACCGVVGLKTTWGRVAREGVFPLGPSLDTVGPMARTVADAAVGLRLLEGEAPGGQAVAAAPSSLARLWPGGVDGIDPRVDEAVDAALAATGFELADVPVDGWGAAGEAFGQLLDVEAWATDGHLVGSDPAGVGEEVRARLLLAAERTAEEAAAAAVARERWTELMASLVRRHGVLALPTIPWRPPERGTGRAPGFNALTSPVNFCGFPALSVPVPVRGGSGDGWRVTGLQLVGGPGSEEVLLATAALVEEAVEVPELF